MGQRKKMKKAVPGRFRSGPTFPSKLLPRHNGRFSIPNGWQIGGPSSGMPDEGLNALLRRLNKLKMMDRTLDKEILNLRKADLMLSQLGL